MCPSSWTPALFPHTGRMFLTWTWGFRGGPGEGHTSWLTTLWCESTKKINFFIIALLKTLTVPQVPHPQRFYFALHFSVWVECQTGSHAASGCKPKPSRPIPGFCVPSRLRAFCVLLAFFWVLSVCNLTDVHWNLFLCSLLDLFVSLSTLSPLYIYLLVLLPK